MSDLNASKLASLAVVQHVFPNDDLQLFNAASSVVTPKKTQSAHSPLSSASAGLGQTVRNGLEKMAKFNLINTTPVNTSSKASFFNVIKVNLLISILHDASVR